MMRQAESKIGKKDSPVVRKTVQWRSRDVVRRRVIIEFGNTHEGVVIKEREGGHVEQLYLWSAENTGQVVRILLPKP